jgi:hypothetical protein
LKPTLNLKNNPVVRGFIPDGLRSSPKTCNHIFSDIPSVSGLRLPRSRSGMNPLATGDRIATAIGCNTGPVGAAEGCDLLIWLFAGPKRPKIKRSQPAAAPTWGWRVGNATGVECNTGPVGAAEGCDLLIWLFAGPKGLKIKRSQPSAAPTWGRRVGNATGDLEGLR